MKENKIELVDKLKNARKIMTEYFNKEGYSRESSDYANRFFLEHYPDRERDDVIIKIHLRKALTEIAYEIMYPEDFQ